MKTTCAILISALVLSGCSGSWSDSNVRNAPATELLTPVAAQDVQVLEGIPPTASYDVVTDLVVSVNKTTAFNADPTREQVIAKLKEEAAAVGANAVINTKISEVQVSLMSWGTRTGKGQAVLLSE